MKFVAFCLTGLLCTAGCMTDDTDPLPPGNSVVGDDAQLITLEGAINKGPFVTGSTVNVSPVGASGNPSGAVYSTQTLNDLGEFSVDFQYTGLVSLEGSGFYYNEALGALSGANITLRAFYEVAAGGRQDAHVNIITHLSYNRVRTLMIDGMPFPQAVAQAENELKEALQIGPPNFDPQATGTEMNISGGDTLANAYLLATSAVLTKAAMRRQIQGGSIDANLQEIVNTFASDLQADGALNDDKVAEIAAAKLALDTAEVKTKLATRLADVGSNASVPDLDAVIDQDGDGHPNTTDCLPLDPTRWTGNADLDGDGHDSIMCGGDDCADFAVGWHGADCATQLQLVSVGQDSRCAIQSNGEVLCGQFGTTPNPWADPTHLWRSPQGSRFVSVSVPSPGLLAICGIREDGVMECWDHQGLATTQVWDGAEGWTGGIEDVESSFSSLDTSGGGFCGIDDAGALQCWGHFVCDWQREEPLVDTHPFVPLGNGPITDLTVYDCGVCGLAEDQTIDCWPQDGLLPEGAGVFAPEGQFTDLSVSGDHLCAVGVDQSVGCWLPTGPTATPDGQFVSVSVGGSARSGPQGPLLFSCGVQVDGTVACWENTGGRISVPEGTFVQVALDRDTACGLRTNGVTECWTLEVGQIPPVGSPEGGAEPDEEEGADAPADED